MCLMSGAKGVLCVVHVEVPSRKCGRARSLQAGAVRTFRPGKGGRNGGRNEWKGSLCGEAEGQPILFMAGHVERQTQSESVRRWLAEVGHGQNDASGSLEPSL